MSQEREAALEGLRRAQAQYVAVAERMTDYRKLFREERDAAIHKAVDVGISRKVIAEELDVTPQWINKMLRGEAYGRRSD